MFKISGFSDNDSGDIENNSLYNLTQLDVSSRYLNILIDKIDAVDENKVAVAKRLYLSDFSQLYFDCLVNLLPGPGN